jgi:prolyl-tRNA editing enzyme YbaK/EbsC (Cys-tRNA(Pro) deacylase)
MNDIPNNKDIRDSSTVRLAQLEEVLHAAHIEYSILAHDLTIRSSQEGVDQGIGNLENMAPSFILRSESGFLAAIIRGDTRLSYKKIKPQLKLKDLCLAAPEQVYQVTGSEIGYVSLFNPDLVTIIDRRLTEMDTVYGGCGIPCYTLKINPLDLIALTRAQVFDFTELKEKDHACQKIDF